MTGYQRSKITLTVKEAYSTDQGRSIGRVDRGMMKLYGWRPRDILEVIPKKQTRQKIGVTVFIVKPIDAGLSIVRLDNNALNNLCISPGDQVYLQSIPKCFAQQVTIAPIGRKFRLIVRPSSLKKVLQNRPVHIGERLTLKGKIRRVFRQNASKLPSHSIEKGALGVYVASTTPTGIVVISQQTKVRIIERISSSS